MFNLWHHNVDRLYEISFLVGIQPFPKQTFFGVCKERRLVEEFEDVINGRLVRLPQSFKRKCEKRLIEPYRLTQLPVEPPIGVFIERADFRAGVTVLLDDADIEHA